MTAGRAALEGKPINKQVNITLYNIYRQLWKQRHLEAIHATRHIENETTQYHTTLHLTSSHTNGQALQWL